MLKNRRQLSAAQQQLERLLDARAAVTPDDYPGPLYDAHCGMLDADIARLQSEIDTYLQCERGQVDLAAIDLVDDIGDQLIKARISRRMTQEELAQRLNKKPQQIQRYESTSYKSASLDTLQKVKAAVTG